MTPKPDALAELAAADERIAEIINAQTRKRMIFPEVDYLLTRLAEAHARERSLLMDCATAETKLSLAQDYFSQFIEGHFDLEKDWERLHAREREAREAIRDLLDCGIESDEPSLRYITVQIDRPSWKQAQDIIATKPKEQSFSDRRKGSAIPE